MSYTKLVLNVKQRRRPPYNRPLKYHSQMLSWKSWDTLFFEIMYLWLGSRNGTRRFDRQWAENHHTNTVIHCRNQRWNNNQYYLISRGMAIFLNDGLSSERITGMGTTLKSDMGSEQSESIASWVFRGALWRCNLGKEVSWEIRVFHDLQTHLNCIRIFTGRRDRISAMSSSKRTDIGAPLFGWRDLGGEREAEAMLLGLRRKYIAILILIGMEWRQQCY